MANHGADGGGLERNDERRHLYTPRVRTDTEEAEHNTSRSTTLSTDILTPEDGGARPEMDNAGATTSIGDQFEEKYSHTMATSNTSRRPLVQSSARLSEASSSATHSDLNETASPRPELRNAAVEGNRAPKRRGSTLDDVGRSRRPIISAENEFRASPGPLSESEGSPYDESHADDEISTGSDEESDEEDEETDREDNQGVQGPTTPRG